jgi:hypothetical protein
LVNIGIQKKRNKAAYFEEETMSKPMPEITQEQMRRQIGQWIYFCNQTEANNSCLHCNIFQECHQNAKAILAELGKPNGVPEIMFNIQEESPLECSFEEDARYHWPKRWEKLGGMNLMVVKGVVDERS